MQGDASGEPEDHGGAMVDRDDLDEGGEPVYDIRLGRRPSEVLRVQCPFGHTSRTAAQTALRGPVREPAQLDALLEKLLSVGLVLDDVQRLADPSTTEDGTAIYEVRVEGEIGVPLLRYLNWRHDIVPEQTLVRVAAGSVDLLRYLKAYTEAGASIERIRRVFPARRAGRA